MEQGPMARRWPRSIRLAEVTGSRANNFDVLRLGAALLVLFAHCYPLSGGGSPGLGLLWDAVGDLGVPVFFGISGFLIARSWASAPHLTVYAGKRALRLLPALIVAVGLTAFVVGPLFTTWPLASYLTDPTPWIYVARCSVLVTFAGTLPGVFADNPFPDAVNGSLWTLPVEATAYAAIALLGVTGLLRRRWALPLAGGLALLLSSPAVDLDSLVAVGAQDGTNGGSAALVLHLLAIFLVGSLLFAHRARVRLSWPVALVAAAALVLTARWAWGDVVEALVVPYLVLVAAYRTPAALRALTRPGDVSYGVYIYAFPVQQSIAALWSGVTPLAMFAVAAPVAYLLGLASWRLVERPALARKRRLQRAAEPEGAVLPRGVAPATE